MNPPATSPLDRSLPHRLNRRDALRALSSGTLLALGLWPGRLRADVEIPSTPFRFVVINDTHCTSPECAKYLERVARQIRREEPEFVLHAGDLTDNGRRTEFGLIREAFSLLPVPVHVTIGNHDYVTQTDRGAYIEANPGPINRYFTHRGWQFLTFDTTEGQRYEKTRVPAETLRWLDDTLPKLNPRKPTVAFTHFPLGIDVNYRPLNSDAVLDRFLDFNLQAIFSGHYHAFTERQTAGVVLTTNRCCSRVRGNHDGSKEKGYFLCSAQDGKIFRSFVEHRE